jgi:hypothetical protein
MRTAKLLGLASAAICAGIGIRAAWLYPLWESEDGVREWILRQTPLGSSSNEVRTFIAKRGWKSKYDWMGTPSPVSEKQFPAVKGSHIIGADLGGYQGLPFHVDLDAYWGFDASGRLIDLRVRKMADGI